MPGETEQQYTAWLLYCELGSIDKLLKAWEGMSIKATEMPPELAGFFEKLGEAPNRKTIARWSKKYQWVKRTDLKLAEDLEGMREKSKRIAREKKHKILDALKRIADKKLKQLADGEAVTMDDWKKIWEMAQVEMGLPTSTTRIEQSPPPAEDKKEDKKFDDALKQFVRKQISIGETREGKRPILDTQQQNKK